MAKLVAASLAFMAVLFSLAGMVQGSAFRGSNGVSTGHMRVEDLRAAMLDELMSALGHGNRVTESRLQDIEEALRPMFRSLHKNEHGHLEHSSLRYVLHRLFVMRHGMFIKGLEPGREGWIGTNATDILDDLVPSYVLELFEQRLNGRGLGMHEVAILAATLEHLIHDEATAMLKMAYQLNDVPVEGVMSSQRAETVVDTYMMLFILGINDTNLTESAQHQMKNIKLVYPLWHESQKFTRDVQNEVISANKEDLAFGHGILSFGATSRIVEEIMERYGRWQNKECKDLKSALMSLESKASGRVLLKDFYGSAKGGAWQFTESVAFLQELGALDESAPGRTSVLIPNYINARSNCLASTSMYSVCCLNECEPLLGHVESVVGAPDETPERLIEIVSNLPSSTIQAPREISAEMRGLLEDVARQHNGKVPLHGRLFSQWLHHQYPRECPYPHMSGTTNPMTASEWTSEKGLTSHVSADEMNFHIETVVDDCKAGGCNTSVVEPTPLRWTMEEELVVSTTTASPTTRKWRSCFLSSVMALAALTSLAMTVWSNFQGALKAVGRRSGTTLPFAGKAHYC